MGESDRGRKMFALLILPSAALAWRPAPGIPLERQLPANRQTTGSGSGSGTACDYDPWTQECNGTEIWCDSGYYTGTSGDQCWYGNYCLQLVNEWDGCPGICHTPCNWDAEDYCDMGMDENNCWMGNWCQDESLGGCPSHTGSGSSDYSGSTSTCAEAYTQECNSTELYCDAGMDSEGCWYGCWMGNWCQDKSMGGCPPPMGGSELNSGEDICAHMTYTEECSNSQISCDSGYSYEG